MLAGKEPRPLPIGPLTLPACVDLALRTHPDLGAAAARAEGARGKLVQAGLYPNPTVTYEADDINTPGGRAGRQGVAVAQDIITGGKLGFARNAAAAGVEAADFQAITQVADVTARVRSAYYDALAARREVEEHRTSVRLAEENAAAAEQLQRAGNVSQPDVLRATVELQLSRNRLRAAERRVEATWRLLALALGTPDLPEQALAGKLDDPVPSYTWGELQAAVLTHSAELRAAEAEARQADAQVRQAEAQITPDLQLHFRPYYAFPDRSIEFAVGVGAALPLFNRNQGNIIAAQADAARARDTIRQVELKLTERLTAAFQRYEADRPQAENYRRHILPAAEEALRLVRLAYTSGGTRYDYTAVLEAQRTLVQSRLGYVEVLADLQRAVAEIEGLVQRPLDANPTP